MITEAKDLMNAKDNALAAKAIKKIITQKRRSQQHIQEGSLSNILVSSSMKKAKT